MKSVVLCAGCLAACGRIGFDQLGAGDATTNGIGDGALSSCAGLAATCGPAGTSPCCGSSIVPGGTFYRSYDVGSDGTYSDMTNPATVSDFRFDTYEVTVGRFRQFVNAGMGTQASPPQAGAGARTLNGMANQGGWDPSWNESLTANTAALLAAVSCDATPSWTDSPGANEALPMTCISWFEAFAFCAWDGGFLATDAEWNYAAVGGAEQRAYPWSNPASDLTIDCSHANYQPAGVCENPPNGGVNRVGSESPTGDGKWGQADLAGNALEFALDWYQATLQNPCNDCAVLTASGAGRMMRGGDYDSVAPLVRGADHFFNTLAREDFIGTRCARAP